MTRARTSRTMRRCGIHDGYSIERRRAVYRGPERPGDVTAAQLAYGQYVIAEYRRRVEAGLPPTPYLTEQELTKQRLAKRSAR